MKILDIKFYKIKLNEKQLNKTLNDPIATISGHFRTVFDSLNLQIALKYESYKNLISAKYCYSFKQRFILSAGRTD